MIRLDSGAETAEGNLYAPLARLGLLPEIASTAEAHDADGNRLSVTVDHIDDMRVHFAPIWSTWRDANKAPPRG